MENIKHKPFYKPFRGILVPGLFKYEGLEEVVNYKPTSEDVFIVTYPKCGTTWMQVVALHIFRKGVELENYEDFRNMCPFIDHRGMEGIVNMPRPGALKTHLPYNLMPYSADAKYIFVLRNPKDTCVSLYYHARGFKAFDYSGIFDDFYELFLAGEVEYGDYFDHLQSWYPHRNDKGIFHTTYEDMKEDLKGVVLSLAKFLGDEYIAAIEKDNSVLHNILRYSSFEHMKKQLVKEFDHDPHKSPENDSQSMHMQRQKETGFKTSHFRKGIVGDWRSHFSDDQSKRMNKRFFERFGGTDIYEKYRPFL